MSRKSVVAFTFAMLPAVAAAQTSAAPTDSGVFAPGVQHVCVPSSDGEGWDCGTESAPPENYRAPEPEAVAPAAESIESTDPEASNEDTPLPPAFLMDPDRITPYAPPVLDEPPVEAPAVAESVADQAPASTLAEPAPSPIGAPVEPVAVVPVVPPVVAAAAEPPKVTATEVAPVPTTAPMPVNLVGADAFAQLPATSFTLQLAYADRVDGFASLVAALGLDPATCYVLRMRDSNGNTWLLAHGAFSDVAAARTAQAALPRVAGLSAQWPRRIGALQTELTDSER